MLNKMGILVIIFCLLITTISYGEVVLHRYYNRITGDEEGYSYSGEDGRPAVLTPERNVTVIDESEKEFYANLHRQQMKAKVKVIKDAKKARKKIIKDKLKAGTPLDQQDVDILLGD